MSRYGEALEGTALIAQFEARKLGVYEFELQPDLWKCPDIAPYYKTRAWHKVFFTDPPPDIPNESGIYMFVAAPHCGGLTDHSYIFYVGKATNLRTRYSEYLMERKGFGHSPRERVVKFLNHLQEFVFFHYTLVPKEELDQAEKLLKDNLTPYANTQVNVIGRLIPPT